MDGEVGRGASWLILVRTWTRWKIFSPRCRAFDLIKTTLSILNRNHTFPQRWTFWVNLNHDFDFGFDSTFLNQNHGFNYLENRPWNPNQNMEESWTRSLTCLCLSRLGLGLSLVRTIGNEKSARSFSDRSFFVDVRAACPCQNSCFSRIWRAWPKFSAGCPQGRPEENFGFWADFSFLKQAHDASVCGLIVQIMAMASPTCLKSHFVDDHPTPEGHSHKRNPENRCINLTNQCPYTKLMCK